jgi:exosortase A-associated hydrolase 2
LTVDAAADGGVARPEVFFLDGLAGRLFCAFWPALPTAFRSAAGTSPAVIVLPAFAEEMNKTRRMLSLFAQRAQAAGISTLIPDLYGTGDSEGDFGDATLEIWADDLRRGIEWLGGRTQAPVSVLALRFGALMLNLLPRGLAPGGNLALWQPVASGKVFAGQFLRLRLAGNMLAGGDGRMDSTALRKQLEDGGRLEIAGYDLSARLLNGMEALDLKSAPVEAFSRISVFETGTVDGEVISPAVERVFSSWDRPGVQIERKCVAGDPFWATTEIATVPSLLTQTVCALSGGARRQ